MTIQQAILGFAAIVVVLTIIPGLDTTLVLRSALAYGPRYSYAVALGISLGTLSWGILAAIGAAVLFTSANVYRIAAMAGVGYLLYLGARMIFMSFRERPVPDGGDPVIGRRSMWRMFGVGALTNLSNPKIGVFYIATIPQFVPEGYSPLTMGVLLAGVHDIIGLIWASVIILGASVARRRLSTVLSRPDALRIIDRVAGAVIIILGILLAIDSFR